MYADRRIASPHRGRHFATAAGPATRSFTRRVVLVGVLAGAGYAAYELVTSFFFSHTKTKSDDPIKHEADASTQQPAAERPTRPKLVVLGSGWGAISLCKHIDTSKYDVTVVSPRNYMLMTPLLASLAVGVFEFSNFDDHRTFAHYYYHRHD